MWPRGLISGSLSGTVPGSLPRRRPSFTHLGRLSGKVDVNCILLKGRLPPACLYFIWMLRSDCRQACFAKDRFSRFWPLCPRGWISYRIPPRESMMVGNVRVYVHPGLPALGFH